MFRYVPLNIQNVQISALMLILNIIAIFELIADKIKF